MVDIFSIIVGIVAIVLSVSSLVISVIMIKKTTKTESGKLMIEFAEPRRRAHVDTILLLNKQEEANSNKIENMLNDLDELLMYMYDDVITREHFDGAFEVNMCIIKENKQAKKIMKDMRKEYPTGNVYEYVMRYFGWDENDL